MTAASAQRAVLDRMKLRVELDLQRQLHPRSPESALERYSPQYAQRTQKQREFLALDCREALYGGAAGGGKSSALLMAALQYVDVPGYAALLFRKTFADLNLPGALIDRAMEWLAGTDARWNGQDKRWTFPSGATLTFGYLEHEQDRLRYQSAEFQFIGFDELTQFSETQYRYLFSRLRRGAGVAVPLRMRAASNPGGPGHDWVRQRFLIDGAVDDRVFVAARLDDNPYLDREQYLASLSELDPFTRQQLEAGDWDAQPAGKKFRREWFQIVPDAPRDLRVARYWDLAATEPKPGSDPDWTVGVKMGERDGRYWVLDVQRLRATPLAVEQLIAQTATLDGIDVAQHMEQEPGSSGVNTIDNYARKVLAGYAFYGHKTTGPKELRANPYSSAAQAGNVSLVQGPWCGPFLDEHQAFPTPGIHDDQVDAASGAFAELRQTDPGAPAAGAASPLVSQYRQMASRVLPRGGGFR